MDFTNATWRKSTRSYSNGDCVEVGSGPSHVGVRDSKNRGAAHLIFGRPAWSTFLARYCP